MKRILLFLNLLIVANLMYSQCGTPGWFCMETGNFVVSDGNILTDDGGGGPYTDANYTMTLCPDTPGDVVQLTFNAFAMQTSPNANNSDYVSIFDGDNTSAPSLGSYTGTSIQGLQITGTVFNVSGCLTIVFNDNSVANTTFPGFEAEIQCTTPCANPTNGSQILSPDLVTPGIQTVQVCMNADVTFGSQGSFAEPGFNLTKYIWNFDDGTILNNANGNPVTHAFSEPGEYVVTLTVEDDNFGDDPVGCQSLNVIPLQVLVSTIPTYSGMTDLVSCIGESVIGTVVVGDPNAIPIGTEIGGGASGTTWTALPPQVVAGQTYLADGAGFAYSTSLTFDFFEPGATLTNCNDLLNIFVNMEHSYMGDLGVFITCPDGTMVNLVTWGTNGGGGTYLGVAIDDENTSPGVGWDYWWTPTATNGTWGQNATGNTSLPSGTYQPSGNLCDLVGCPLNGQWSFSVTDNLAIDNGYIFAWGIGFAPSLFPDITTFTPIIGAGPDSSYWVITPPTSGGQWITDITPDGDEISITATTVGTYDYTYVVINNFGCQFDSTIQLIVQQAPQVNAGLDQLYSCGTVNLNATLDGGTPMGAFIWDWNPTTGLSSSNTQNTTVNTLTQTTTFHVTGYPTGHPQCSSTDEVIVSIDPLGDPGENATITRCSTDAPFPMLPQLGGNPVTSGVWYNPSLVAIPSGQFDPMVDPPGNYLYSVQFGNCEAHAVLTINMAGPTIISIPNDTSICELGSVNMELYSLFNGQPNFTYTWTYDGNVVSGQTSATYAPANSGEVCLNVLDACGYSVTNCFQVEVKPAIDVQFSFDTTAACWPHTFQMTNLVDPTLYSSSIWEISDGITYQNTPLQSHDFLAPGTYTVKLTLTNILGCSYSNTQTVIAYPEPVAGYSATPQPTNILDTEIHFTDASQGNIVAWNWQFGTGLAASASANPVVEFPNGAGDIYPVMLTVTDINNCVDVITAEIVINDILSVYIPNSFTPNNDGINDVLFVMGADFDPKRFSFMVFNRFGDKVFETNDHTIPWVGDTYNGEYFVPNGTYNWIAVVVSKTTGERKELSGYINLFR